MRSYCFWSLSKTLLTLIIIIIFFNFILSISATNILKISGTLIIYFKICFLTSFQDTSMLYGTRNCQTTSPLDNLLKRPLLTWPKSSHRNSSGLLTSTGNRRGKLFVPRETSLPQGYLKISQSHDWTVCGSEARAMHVPSISHAAPAAPRLCPPTCVAVMPPWVELLPPSVCLNRLCPMQLPEPSH